MMNNILAKIAGFSNGIFAILLVIGGIVLGDSFDNQTSGYGAILGLVLGMLLTVIICGTLAVFISIRNELVIIRGIIYHLSEKISER